MLTILALAFSLQTSDRVVFYGDSITEQRLYTTYVEAFVRTRYPALQTTFTTVGVGGDATWGGYLGDPATRVTRDVKPQNPSRIVIMLGMNDGGYVPYDPKIDATFVEWYGKLLNLMHDAAPKAKVTLVQTSPYDDVTDRPNDFRGYNDTLLRFGENVSKIAYQRKCEFVDFNRPVNEALKQCVSSNAQEAAQFLPDHIHPGPAGHLIMAQTLLKSWNADPVVSDVVLDAKSKQVVRSAKTKVSGYDGLKWTQKDECLPFFLEGEMALGARFSHFDQELNQEMLKITNFEGSSGVLSIDDKDVGTFTREQLEAGINLSQLDTPMRQQAAKVLNLVMQKNEVFFAGWHHASLMNPDFPSTHRAAQAMYALSKDIDDSARKNAVPKSHTYRLKVN